MPNETTELWLARDAVGDEFPAIYNYEPVLSDGEYWLPRQSPDWADRVFNIVCDVPLKPGEKVRVKLVKIQDETLMGRIPASEYVEFCDHMVVTSQLLELYHTPEEIENFTKWLRGQTGVILEDGTHGFYASNYERWFYRGQV